MSKIQEIRNSNKRKTLGIPSFAYNFSKFINRHNSLKHERVKIIKALELAYEGNEVYVEVPLINNKKADIYVSDLDVVIEIKESESDKSIKNKIKNYPCEVRVIDAKEVRK